MAVTANAGVSPYGPHVELSASGGTGPFTWRAFPTGGTDYAVPAVVTDPTGRTTWDGYAPLGRDVLYRVTDSLGAVGEAQVTVPDPGGGVLSDATDPNRWIAVPVMDQLPNEWEGRSVWFDVLDRRDPFVAVAPLRLRNGELVVRVVGNDQRTRLMDLLAVGTPILVRSSCSAALDDVVMLPITVRESLIVETDKDGPREVRIQYQAVTRDLGPYMPDPSWTWDDVAADPRLPSWDAFVATFATWDDAAGNIRS